MEDILSFAFSGIFSLLILSLTFNFLLAIRLHLLDRKVDVMDKRSREEAKLIDKRLRVVKEQITKKKGILL
ncbi:MAG: hypothetical protein ACE5HY_04560 [Candidatus Hydrothermarchaeales archaeon]